MKTFVLVEAKRGWLYIDVLYVVLLGTFIMPLLRNSNANRCLWCLKFFALIQRTRISAVWSLMVSTRHYYLFIWRFFEIELQYTLISISLWFCHVLLVVCFSIYSIYIILLLVYILYRPFIKHQNWTEITVKNRQKNR